MALRKVMDPARWFCVARPQYQNSCGMHAVVSCWNYLYSTLGHGTVEPITPEMALEIVGFIAPFDTKQYQYYTFNETLMSWFHILNKALGVKGKAHICFKLLPSGATHEVSESDQALEMIKSGLRSKTKAFIYHCYWHYMCPVGYEECPKQRNMSYTLNNDSFTTWIMIADTALIHPPFHIRKW